MLGIGGDLVIGPLLLEMGLMTQVFSATSAFLVLLISSSTTIQFSILGMLDIHYGAFMATVCIFGAIAGKST